MAMSLETLEKLVALDPGDPLSRFALGKKLYETSQNLPEAADHLRFANIRDPTHLATYLNLAKTLIALGHAPEARDVLTRGIARASLVTEGMGKDLAPLMQSLIYRLDHPETVFSVDITVRFAQPDEVVDLRHRVLRLGMPRDAAIFPTDTHPTTVHVLATVSGKPACCATFIAEPPPDEFVQLLPRTSFAYRLRGMSTDEAFRSMGLGRRVLGMLESAVLERHGGEKILLWCNARIGAVRFYLRENWEVRSPAPYKIPTAGLHHTMTKDLG